MKFIAPNKELITLLQLSAPIAVYCALADHASWGWWALSVLFYFLYCAIGNNVALHRYFTHKQFKVSKPTEWFFTWCATMSGLGSPISYAIPHLVHHKYPDSELDPHGPGAGRRSLLYYFHRHLHINEKTLTSRRIFELTRTYCKLHKNYWLIVAANAGIMLAIDWKVFLFCWWLPSTLTLWAVSLGIYMQHENGGASNTRSYSWFGWGEGLHKNHHIIPGTSNTALKPGEFDYTHWIASWFAKKDE